MNYHLIKGHILFVFLIKLTQATLMGLIFLIGLIFIKIHSKEINNSDQVKSVAIKIFKEVKANIKKYIVIILKKEILIMLGFMLFIIPGFYLYMQWYLVYPCMADNINEDPFKRSKELINGRYLIAFMLLLLMFLLFIFSVCFSFIFGKILAIYLNILFSYKVFLILGLSISILFGFPILIVFDYNLFKFWQNKMKKQEFQISSPN